MKIRYNNKIKHTREIAAYPALSSAIDNGAGTVVLFSLPLPLPLPCGAGTCGIAEGVKQHTALLNLQANWGKQVQRV